MVISDIHCYHFDGYWEIFNTGLIMEGVEGGKDRQINKHQIKCSLRNQSLKDSE